MYRTNVSCPLSPVSCPFHVIHPTSPVSCHPFHVAYPTLPIPRCLSHVARRPSPTPVPVACPRHPSHVTHPTFPPPVPVTHPTSPTPRPHHPSHVPRCTSHVSCPLHYFPGPHQSRQKLGVMNQTVHFSFSPKARGYESNLIFLLLFGSSQIKIDFHCIHTTHYHRSSLEFIKSVHGKNSLNACQTSNRRALISTRSFTIQIKHKLIDYYRIFSFQIRHFLSIFDLMSIDIHIQTITWKILFILLTNPDKNVIQMKLFSAFFFLFLFLVE